MKNKIFNRRSQSQSEKNYTDNNQIEINNYINFIKTYKEIKRWKELYSDKIITKSDILFSFIELNIIFFSLFLFSCSIDSTDITQFIYFIISIAVSTLIIIFLKVTRSLGIPLSEMYNIHQVLLQKTGNIYFKMFFYKQIKKNEKKYKELVKELSQKDNEYILFLIKDSKLNNYLKKKYYYEIKESSDFEDFECFYNEKISSMILLKDVKIENNEVKG